MLKENKWAKYFREHVIDKTAGIYSNSDKTVLCELFFMLCREIFDQDEDRMYCGEEFKVKAYITVLEDFLVPSELSKFNQLISDMYKERDGYGLLQEESPAQT